MPQRLEQPGQEHGPPDGVVGEVETEHRDFHTVRSRRTNQRSVSSASSARPSLQGPNPASALMWPALSSITNRPPQAVANAVARSSETKGSSVLATTIVGNGSRTSGIGLKLRTSSGVWSGDSTSAGATSSAPLARPDVRRAQCATSGQARLCAASAGGVAHSATYRSRAASQSSSFGRSQSSCTTRRDEGSARSQWLCQWSGPESPYP